MRWDESCTGGQVKMGPIAKAWGAQALFIYSGRRALCSASPAQSEASNHEWIAKGKIH